MRIRRTGERWLDAEARRRWIDVLEWRLRKTPPGCRRPEPWLEHKQPWLDEELRRRCSIRRGEE